MFAKLLVIHYIADFLLQPREMGKKKSSEPLWLAGHLAIQFVAFLPFTSFKFALLNALVHGIIDWNIWRGYKWMVFTRLYDVGNGKLGHSLVSDPGYLDEPGPDGINRGGHWRFYEDHWFYATIGLDQLLHMLTLYYLCGWLL